MSHSPSTAVGFPSMDVSTAEQWSHIAQETMRNQPRVGEYVLGMLEYLEGVTDGFSINQLEHSVQTATRAERAGADEEMIVASLCHDVGKAVSVPNHPAISAEVLRPYVRDEVYQLIRAHQDFQGKHYYKHLGKDPDARAQYEGEPWFGMAEQFADEWDQASFDPAYQSEPLKHFKPLVRQIFGHPRFF